MRRTSKFESSIRTEGEDNSLTPIEDQAFDFNLKKDVKNYKPIQRSKSQIIALSEDDPEQIEVREEDLLLLRDGKMRPRALSLVPQEELKKIYKYTAQRELLEIVEKEELKNRTVK